MHTTQKIKMDLLAKQNIQTIHAVQDDTNSRAVQVSLFEGGVPWQVPENSKIFVGYLTENGSSGVYDTLPDGSVAATISGNEITFVLVPAALYPGNTNVTIVIADESGNQISTFPVAVEVEANYSYGASAPESYINLGQWLSASISDLIGGVRYDGAQELTDEQKAQARENIGACQTPLRVTMNPSASSASGYTADKSFEEIQAARNQGRAVDCRVSTMILSLVGLSPTTAVFAAENKEKGYRVMIRNDGSVSYEVTTYLLEPAPTDEIYFDITDDGVLSLKPEYRGEVPAAAAGNAKYADAVSDRGADLAGTLNHELPEEIVVPKVVDGVTATAYAYGMFMGNKRIKRLTLPVTVKTLPGYFCYGTWNLQSVTGTSGIETICVSAFQNSGIRAANFPGLKTLDGKNHFQSCVDMVTADLGNTVTAIPEGCLYGCERLEVLRNTNSITTVGKNGFRDTRRLKTLSFLPNITSIGDYGFFNSRVAYDWESLTNFEEFGTLATPADLYDADYWSGCTFTPKSVPVRSTFSQLDPRWTDKTIGNTTRTYNCFICSAAMAYSALMGVELSSPEEFVELVYAADPSLRDVDPSDDPKDDGSADSSVRYLTAAGFDATWHPATEENFLQTAYDAIADGLVWIQHFVSTDAGD